MPSTGDAPTRPRRLRRGAGRGPGRRAGAGRRPLLRRPRRRLDADGPVLRPRAQARRPAARCRSRTSTSTRRSARLAAAFAPPPALAPPTRARPAGRGAGRGAATVEQVPVDSHFFDDLGADSMLMAQFCARVASAPTCRVSMKDVYQHPTIRRLAAALAGAARQPAAVADRSTGPQPPARRAVPPPASTCAVRALRRAAAPVLPRLPLPRRVRRRPRLRVDRRRHRPGRHLPAVGRWSAARASSALCTAADPGEVGAHRPLEAAADPRLEPGLRPLLDRQDAGPGQPAGPVRRLAALRALPAGAGREDRPRRRDPLQERARVHRPAHHRRRHGHPQGLVLHLLPGPRRHDPDRPVTLGKDVFVGETTVLDIETSLGDGAQLGHASSLHTGQAVPAGERWHGSPAQPTEVDYRTVEPDRLRHLAKGRPTASCSCCTCCWCTCRWPSAASSCCSPRSRSSPRCWTPAPLALTSWTFYRDALAISFVLFFGSPARRLALRGHRPARAQPRHQAGQGLPAVRLPLLGPPDDRADHQHEVLHDALRRQLLHRPLPALARIRPRTASSRPGRTSAPR